MYEIKEITGSALEKVFPLIHELRPKLDMESFLRLHKEAQMRDDYKIVGLVRDEYCYALMGYRILYDFVHGKHLYVDDLVVTKDMRGQGLGKLLIDYAVAEAGKENCTGLRLCTGIENHDGRRFYEREGWNAGALVYKLKL
jgi:GNAT superfamily N-acetyltransferase